MRQGLITATGCGSCAIENVKSQTGQSSIFLHVCLEIPQKHSATYTNTDPRDKGCESGWPGSATESL